ncbi:MAG TPA: hypothetical protein VLY46_07045 [Usitatibacter sp.]|nr:hypothetical protein [Usitatibacter sp.]
MHRIRIVAFVLCGAIGLGAPAAYAARTGASPAPVAVLTVVTKRAEHGAQRVELHVSRAAHRAGAKAARVAHRARATMVHAARTVGIETGRAARVMRVKAEREGAAMKARMQRAFHRSPRDASAHKATHPRVKAARSA